MPYITKDKRDNLALGLHKINIALNKVGWKPGNLNYIFTQLMIGYTDQNGLCYDTINEIIGAIESAKAEYQRRVVGLYEDTKIIENGDVY
jgi:hypothetical protein